MKRLCLGLVIVLVCFGFIFTGAANAAEPKVRNPKMQIPSFTGLSIYPPDGRQSQK